MPQITKVRIVNFQYNDGKRLIADELFDFTHEKKGAADVLINLANGGGKSVLVQLMMQPVLPRAKVAGRRIESFFTRATDHCFVVLEWALDGGSMKLMTGIALSASDAKSDSDAQRGFQIKYYTFLSTYPHHKEGYDIITLPLSRREKGVFYPASFDEIRTLCRKSGGALERYASDDRVRWRERLAQFGIFEREWRLIEALNSNEDGLSKYFSTRKTSDAVIDQLILPRIEERLHTSPSNEDSSLETMLISYARQFSRQQAFLQERDTLQGFSDLLTAAQEQAAKLWSDHEAFQDSTQRLFALQDALQREILLRQQTAASLGEQQQALGEQIRQIRWEQASAAYYDAAANMDAQARQLRAAEEARSAGEAQLAAAREQLCLLECARYHRALQNTRAQLAAVEEAIHAREHNSASAQRLASLKYSVLVCINARLEQLSPEIARLQAEAEAGEDALSALRTELEALRREQERSADAVSRTQGALDQRTEENDRTVKRLGIDALRNLDGQYWKGDLLDWQSSIQGQEEAVADEAAALGAEIDALEQRREAIPQEQAEAAVQVQQLRQALQGLEGQLGAYHDLEAQVRAICQQHSLDFALRFTGQHRAYLAQQMEQTQAGIRTQEREIAAREEAHAAVGRGTLHIPKALLDYLERTGLHYTSLEHWLLRQQKQGLLSREQMLALLERNPCAAYSVKLNASDLNALRQEAEGQWLPAVLPVLTDADVERMLRGEDTAPPYLAAYARSYFADSDSFAQGLEKEIAQRKERHRMLLDRLAGLGRSQGILEAFAAYEETWEQRTVSEREAVAANITALERQIAHLKAQQRDVKQAIAAARTRREQLRERQSGFRDKLNGFASLMASLEEEAAMRDRLARQSRELDALRRNIQSRERSLAEQEGLLTDLARRRASLEALQQALREGKRDVSGAGEAQIVEGDWESLLMQYRSLLDSLSNDLHRLTAQREGLRKEEASYQWELGRRGCREEAYAALVWSEALEDAAARGVEAAESALQSAQDGYAQASRAYGYAESGLHRAQADLKPYGGEPLPLAQVGTAFARRIQAAQDELRQVASRRKTVEQEAAALERVLLKAQNAAEPYPRPLQVPSLALEGDAEAQFRTLAKELQTREGSVRAGEQQVRESLGRMLDAYAASEDVRTAVTNMQTLLDHAALRGDRYYTLHEHMGEALHLAALRIGQIDTDLREFHKAKGDLVLQCVIQGRQMYEGLMQLSQRSKVRLQGRRRAMLRFDIPEQVDEALAAAAVTARIDRAAQEIAARLTEDAFEETALRKIAADAVSGRHLLRRYIGRESIVLRAYKIDRNPKNSGYRTWEQTQVINSGAEKFVVYFAVILAMLAFASDSEERLDGEDVGRVLVLDNPFGPISSRHVLEPMFEIARNYHVQMICLTDISKSDIVACFDLVIRAVIKTSALGGREHLTHQENETIEHGFYCAEQINLF